MFVDIHNHILPGIDDGAPTMGHAVEMARQAVKCGTDTLVASPHLASGARRSAPPDWVRELTARLQTMLNIESVPLTVVPGVEIPISESVADGLTAGTLLTIGGAGSWALIEPPFERIPRDGLDNISAIRDAGFGVVLAHPERNSLIQRSLEFVEACMEFGVVIQLTTGSLLGHFGPGAQRTAEAILHHAADWPIVLSSDAHDLRERTTGLMAQARDAAALLVGPDAAQEMVDSRPRSLLAPK